jgi:hypothetical protein
MNQETKNKCIKHMTAPQRLYNRPDTEGVPKVPLPRWNSRSRETNLVYIEPTAETENEELNK